MPYPDPPADEPGTPVPETPVKAAGPETSAEDAAAQAKQWGVRSDVEEEK
jgi:hypothetical protein